MGGGRGLERGPSDFGSIFAWIYGGAERSGDELSAKADAEDGLARGQALSDAGDFIVEERVIVAVVDPDGASKDDEEIARSGVFEGKARRGDIDGLNVKASLPQRRVEGAKILKSNVAEHECSAGRDGHGSIVS